MNTHTLQTPCPDTSLSAYGAARSTIAGKPLSPDELQKIDAYWRASLYLCLGMLYLKANPLPREPLSFAAHHRPTFGPPGPTDPTPCARQKPHLFQCFPRKNQFG
jgi:XFP N-terminal domain